MFEYHWVSLGLSTFGAFFVLFLLCFLKEGERQYHFEFQLVDLRCGAYMNLQYAIIL